MLEDIKEFLTGPDRLLYLIKKIIIIFIIVVGTKIIIHFGSIIIEKFFQKQKNSKFGFNEKKADTLSGLLKSILKYTLYIIGILTILDQIGFEIRTLLLGAGLGGVAIGLGAQSLIKDIINGFFIIFEDQFSVGDYVTIDKMEGIVEAVGLRTTKIKAFSGDLHIIPNSQISIVTNHSRDNSRALVEIEIGYDVNIDKALEVLKKVAEDIKSSNHKIVEGPTVLGVSKFGESGITLSMAARTIPMSQWEIERQLRKKIKEYFDRENINIPYPTRVLITKNGDN